MLPEDSLSDVSVLDMEVDELNASSLGVQATFTADIHGPSVKDSLYPGVVSAQSPVASVCPDLSVVNEVSEASRNPSSRRRHTR